MSAPRTKKKVGQLALVAAGPGDPELLTLRAVSLLQLADTVVVDADALAIMGDHVPTETTVTVAVDADGVPLDPAGRAKLAIEAFRAGHRVVRLMAGDPFLDGTAALESAALRRARVPFEVAPGVSTLTGTAAYAGFGLTEKNAGQVHVVTDTEATIGSMANKANMIVNSSTIELTNVSNSCSTLAAPPALLVMPLITSLVLRPACTE